MKKLIYAATVIAALFPGVGSAFVELQGLEPNPALSGQNINLLLRSGICDRVLEVTSVTRDGNEIEVITEGIRHDGTCGFSIADSEFELGAFPVGNYTVTIRYHFDSLGGATTETIGMIPLVVGAPQPVPAGQWWGFFILWLLVLGAGLVALRYKGREGYA